MRSRWFSSHRTECICRREMVRVVSRVRVWQDLSGGSLLGCISEVMLVRVGTWGVNVLVMTMGMMSTCVPDTRERSAFTRGLYLSMRWWDGVLYDTVRASFTWSYLNFTHRGVSAAGGAAYKAGFK
jgi:hypothetical protein